MWDTTKDYRILVASKARENYLNLIPTASFRGSWNKALVWSKVESLIASQHLLVELGVYLHSIFLNQDTTGFIVTLALDALDFGKLFTEYFAQFHVVVNLHIVFAIDVYKLYYVVGFTQVVGPSSDKLTVAHVAFFNILTRLDAVQLSHQTIHHLLVVASLISLGIGNDTQLYQLGIGHVIESKKVGASLFESRTVSLQSVGVDTGEQLARAVSQALMQVGVQVTCNTTILFEQFTLNIAVNKLFVETVTLGSLGISLGYVVDSNRLRAMSGTYPVGIGEVDTDSS